MMVHILLKRLVYRMKAKCGRKKDKTSSPRIGKWLKCYFEKNNLQIF